MRDADVPAAFRPRFYLQLAASALTFAVGAAMAWFHKGRSHQTSLGGEWMVVWIVAIIALVAFTQWNWRCPKCASNLGRIVFIRECPSCHVALRG